MGLIPFLSPISIVQQVQTSFVLRLKTCVTSLPIFLLNLEATPNHPVTTSKTFSPASVLMLMRSDLAKLFLSFLAKTLMKFLLRVKKNLLQSHRVALLPPEVPLPLVAPTPQLRRRRKLNPLRATPVMTIWDSDFSTKSSPRNRPRLIPRHD